MKAGPRRVLLITGRADSGGGPEHVFQLARQLMETCEVFIAAPNEVPFWERYGRLVGADKIFEIPHRRFSWSAFRGLAAWCRRQKIDVVHSHGRAAGLYSRLLPRWKGVVSVHTQHGTLQFKSGKDFIYWFAELLMARRTDQLIAVSQSEAEQMGRRLMARNRLTAIPNGVALPSTSVTPVGHGARPLRIIHITRFVPQKNSGMVLSILAAIRQQDQLDRFHVDVLGDGPGRPAFEAEVARRGFGQYFTFHGVQLSVTPFFASGFCLLTTSRWEGLPLAVLEALAVGLPVIASDIAGNNDVVGEGVGRLFPLDNPALAGQQIVELADNPDRWAKLSKAAVTLVAENFSARRMAHDTAALYDRLVTVRTGLLKEKV